MSTKDELESIMIGTWVSLDHEDDATSYLTMADSHRFRLKIDYGNRVMQFVASYLTVVEVDGTWSVEIKNGEAMWHLTYRDTHNKILENLHPILANVVYAGQGALFSLTKGVLYTRIVSYSDNEIVGSTFGTRVHWKRHYSPVL